MKDDLWKVSNATGMLKSVALLRDRRVREAAAAGHPLHVIADAAELPVVAVHRIVVRDPADPAA